MNTKENMFRDLTGERFGRLTVLGLDSKRDWARWWRCRCDCGNETIVKSASLMRRKESTKSCGCLQREWSSKKKGISTRRLPYGESSFNKLYAVYQTNAKKRSLVFDLDKNAFKALTKKNCYYCGVEPYQIFTNGNSITTGEYIYNGLDRIDDELGYSIENVVPCCGQCNRAKNNTNKKEFIEWIYRVHSNLEKNIAKW